MNQMVRLSWEPYSVLAEIKFALRRRSDQPGSVGDSNKNRMALSRRDCVNRMKRDPPLFNEQAVRGTHAPDATISIFRNPSPRFRMWVMLRVACCSCSHVLGAKPVCCVLAFFVLKHGVCVLLSVVWKHHPHHAWCNIDKSPHQDVWLHTQVTACTHVDVCTVVILLALLPSNLKNYIACMIRTTHQPRNAAKLNKNPKHAHNFMSCGTAHVMWHVSCGTACKHHGIACGTCHVARVMWHSLWARCHMAHAHPTCCACIIPRQLHLSANPKDCNLEIVKSWDSEISRMWNLEIKKFVDCEIWRLWNLRLWICRLRIFEIARMQILEIAKSWDCFGATSKYFFTEHKKVWT